MFAWWNFVINMGLQDKPPKTFLDALGRSKVICILQFFLTISTRIRVYLLERVQTSTDIGEKTSKSDGKSSTLHKCISNIN